MNPTGISRKPIRSRWRTGSTSLAVVAGLLLANPQVAVPAPRFGGRAVIQWPSELPSMHPLRFRSIFGNNYRELLYANGLTRIGPKQEPQPDLAESWRVSADGLTYTFRLRRRARWHDGQPFTARDVKYTWEAIAHPDYSGAYRAEVEIIKGYEAYNSGQASDLAGVKVIDDHTLEVRLEQPYAPFVGTTTNISIVPEHVLRSVPVRDHLRHPFSRRPIGTGPFEMVEWRANETMVFRAYEAYHLGRAKLDEVIFRVVPDDATQAANLRTGSADVGGFFFTISQADARAFEADTRFAVLRQPGVTAYFLEFDHTKPHLQDRRLRQAIWHAIDRNKIINTIFEGRARIAHGHIFPSSWAYDADLPKVAHDPNKARQLLQEAGWRPGPDGIRERGGQRLSLSYNSQMATATELALPISADLKAVGIEVKLVPTQVLTLVSDVWQAGRFEVLGTHWASGIFPHPSSGLARFYGCERGGRPNSRSGYCRRRFDELIAAATTVADRTVQKQRYAEIQRWMAQEAIRVWLIWPDNAVVMNRALITPKVETDYELMSTITQWYWQR